MPTHQWLLLMSHTVTLDFPPWFYHCQAWLLLQCCCRMCYSIMQWDSHFVIIMASIKKTYFMKDVIERLNREADDEVDNSGDGIGCWEWGVWYRAASVKTLVFTGDSDDDNPALGLQQEMMMVVMMMMMTTTLNPGLYLIFSSCGWKDDLSGCFCEMQAQDKLEPQCTEWPRVHWETVATTTR